MLCIAVPSAGIAQWVAFVSCDASGIASFLARRYCSGRLHRSVDARLVSRRVRHAGVLPSSRVSRIMCTKCHVRRTHKQVHTRELMHTHMIPRLSPQPRSLWRTATTSIFIKFMFRKGDESHNHDAGIVLFATTRETRILRGRCARPHSLRRFRIFCLIIFQPQTPTPPHPRLPPPGLSTPAILHDISHIMHRSSQATALSQALAPAGDAPRGCACAFVTRVIAALPMRLWSRPEVHARGGERGRCGR